MVRKRRTKCLNSLAMKIEDTFSLAHISPSDEETQFSDDVIIEEPADMCDVKEEAEYVFLAPTDNCNECDPLAIGEPDNTIPTEKPSSMATEKRLNVYKTKCTGADSLYLPPENGIHSTKMDYRSSIPTRVPHETPLYQYSTAKSAKKARMDARLSYPPKTPVNPVVSPTSCDAEIIVCSSDEEELITPDDCSRVTNPAKRSSTHVPETPIDYSTSRVSDIILCPSVEEEPTTFAESSKHLICASPCLNSLVVRSEGTTTPDSPPAGTDYYWTSDDVPSHSIPFIGRPRLKVQPIGATPYAFFKLIFDKEFYWTFTNQINKCASEMGKENNRVKNKDLKTLITNWTPMSYPELDKWLAILIHKSGMHLPTLSDYWSRGVLHQSSFFSEVQSSMPKDRWMGIMQALHFLKTPGGELKSLEPFFEVSRLIRWFNGRMKEVYEPERELFLEEPVVFSQGCLIPWSCLRDKRRGIKLHSLTEPGGLILRFTSDKIDTSDESAACEVVNTLLKDFRGKGHSVFMDRCYNSVDLCHKLLSHQLYTTGPLSSLRKNFPDKVDSKPELGHVSYARSNHGVVVMNWRDSNDEVLFISSEFSPRLVETSYKSHIKLKPEAVAVFDNHISGFNKPFHELSEYGAVQKHTTNHVKVTLQIIQMAIYNAFVFYKKYGPNTLDFAEFRAELVKGLSDVRKTYVRAEVPTRVWHRIEKINAHDKRNNQAFQRCKECRRNGRKKMVSTCCVVCPDSPALCLGDCFVDWHLHLGCSNVIEQQHFENIDQTN